MYNFSTPRLPVVRSTLAVGLSRDLNVTGGLYVSNSVVELENIPITQSVTIDGSGFLINGSRPEKIKFIVGDTYHFDLSDYFFQIQKQFSFFL